jgi:peptide-methionine (S)-S-oxide reductase
MSRFRCYARQAWLLAATLAGLVIVVIALAAGRDNADAPAATTESGDVAVATFAGGCFWCMEPPYDGIDGVISTVAGYTGGHLDNPTYEQVSSGTTGHAEAVEITYDPARVSYGELLEIFWRNIDPTTPDRQFCDHGSQYRPGIFYHDDAQKREALASREQIEKNKPFKAPIRTEIVAVTKFYPAEDYHQDFYLNNPIRYKYYRFNCGRDQRLRQLWGERS